MDLGVEDRDALPVGGQDVGVGVRAAFDQPVEAQPAQVVAHLADAVGGTPSSAVTRARRLRLVNAGDGVEGDAQGAEPGPWTRGSPNRSGWGPPALLGDGGLRDPLKGWARKDTALADTFSIAAGDG